MASRRRLVARAGLALTIVFAGAWGAHAASLFDPALRFRTLATEHFIIYFHESEAELAPRLATIAEDAWRRVPPLVGAAPPDRTHVVLADQSDVANGWAYPLPYNTIVVTATWPKPVDFIGNTDDWLRLVFVHEFTHIVHLDQARGWARLVRAVFGRTPLSFPNLFLPAWQVEGLATFAESRIAGAGRLNSGDFRQVERSAARRGERQPLDRVNGGLTEWPGGHAPYAYGMGFHEFLAERFGVERVSSLAGRTAGRLPYLGSGAFESVFGRSLGDLWTEYQSALVASAAEREASAGSAGGPTRLTWHGYVSTGPRFAPPPCGNCPPDILYSARTPHEFPGLFAIPATGGAARRVSDRFLGSTTSVRGDTIVFDQIELHRTIGQYSDLYRVHGPTGRIERLTNEARLQDPDLSPDGSRIAAVHDSATTAELVILRASTAGARSGPGGEPIVVLNDPGDRYNTPRWSPDGKYLAAIRQRTHASTSPPATATTDLVIVEAGTGRLHAVLRQPGVRIATPAWRPDGRALIVAMAVRDAPFQLFEVSLDREADEADLAPADESVAVTRRLTDLPGGATWPDISGEGRTLAFVGHTPEGLDVFVTTYVSSGAAAGLSDAGFAPEFAAAVDVPPSGTVAPEAAAGVPYRPWATLLPRAWSPIVGSSGRSVHAGVATAGRDVLGYHAYSVGASWRVSAPSGVVSPRGQAPDWFAAYAYDRWVPTFVVTAAETTSFVTRFAAGSDTGSTETHDEREIEAGVVWPFQQIRARHRALATMRHARDRISDVEGSRIATRTALRTGWSSDTTQWYGYSISREHGITAGGTVEWARGSDRTAATITADARLYTAGFGRHHVTAFRFAGGVSTGPRDVRRLFHLGGPSVSADPIDFSRSAASLLRGFPSDSFGGSRVALVNAEYRLPLARPERGVGTWPAFLHSVHAAGFVDAGHAWSDRFRASEAKLAAGGELSFDLIVGYALPLTVTGGAAWGRDGARAATDATTYIRVGAAF